MEFVPALAVNMKVALVIFDMCFFKVAVPFSPREIILFNGS